MISAVVVSLCLILRHLSHVAKHHPTARLITVQLASFRASAAALPIQAYLSMEQATSSMIPVSLYGARTYASMTRI